MLNEKKSSLIPTFLIPHFRSNHAGETGAVFIYKGILTVSKDPEVRDFSHKHQNTESQHLELIEKVLEKKYISKFIIFWKFAGFLTGFIPALLGKKFIYVTIYYVDSFVEKHYSEQISLIGKKKDQMKIKQMICELMGDEITHKDESLKKIANFKLIHRIWGIFVTIGSKFAVAIAKKI